MVSWTDRKALLALSAFLAPGHAYLKGHPNVTALKALAEALRNLAAGTAGARALAAIKGSLRGGDEAGWFMVVLLEHQDDADFASAIELCGRVSASLKLVTADCGGIDHDIAGRWKEAAAMRLGDDAHEDSIVHELDMYSVVRVNLSGYIDLLEHELLPASEFRAEVDKLKKIIAQLPTANQLMKFQVNMDAGMITWFYNDSYLVDSVVKPANKYSRSGMLAALVEVQKQLQTCYATCAPAFPPSQDARTEHERLYDVCKGACKTWTTLAAAKLVEKVDVAALVRGREEGRKAPLQRRKSLGDPDETQPMRALLQRLADLR